MAKCDRDVVQAAADFVFNPTTQQPPHLTRLPQDHRLLNENGLAFTMPDLMREAQRRDAQPPQPALSGLLSTPPMVSAARETRGNTPGKCSL